MDKEGTGFLQSLLLINGFAQENLDLPQSNR